MNKQYYNEKAYMFRAMSEIDDYLIAEAQQYRPLPRRRTLSLPVKLAALSLSALVAVTAAMGWMQAELNRGTLPDTDQTSAVSLDQLFVAHRETASYTTLSSQEELPFFEGACYLVWQYADSDELCVSRKLNRSEIRELTQNAKGTNVGESAPNLACRVWIIHEDGTVTSPHLKASDGNVALGEIFDYEAELIPSEKLVSCISEILNRPQ